MDDINELYYLFPEIKENIIVEKKVGQGTFSFVYLGRFRRNEKEKVALKYIIPTSAPTRTKQEIECLLNIGGKENVIGVQAVLRNNSHILILMPYIDHVSFHDSFIYWDLNEVKDYIKNLITALNRVHQCGIIHRDVKPSNFLYDNITKSYALVDFGLAQSYDKSSENIFSLELLSNKKSTCSSDLNTPVRKNMISIAKKITSTTASTCTAHLVLKNPKNPINHLNQNKNEPNSLPHTPSKEKQKQQHLMNSQSYENNLSEVNSVQKTTISPKNVLSNNLESTRNNTPRIKSSTPNLQKYYSFQKPSYSFLDNKCTCFNMPFVCEICTTKSSKWAPRAGTAGFRAPEVLFRSTYQTPSVDIWSVGVIFLCILSGHYPFFKAQDDNTAIMQLISLFGAELVRKNALKYGESLVCSFEKKPLELKEICKSLRKNVIKTLNTEKNKGQKDINEVKENSFFEDFPDSAYDLLKKLLELDCDKRLSAENALKHEFFADN